MFARMRQNLFRSFACNVAGDTKSNSASGVGPHPLAGEVVERKPLARVTGNRGVGQEGIGGWGVSLNFRPFGL